MNYDEIKQRINEIRELKKDWDGYGADPINKKNIELMEIIVDLIYKNEPFVTCFSDGIQIEWEDENSNYLEIEIRDDQDVGMYFQKDTEEYGDKE